MSATLIDRARAQVADFEAAFGYCDEAHTLVRLLSDRCDELLAAMVRLTREMPYPEEANQAGVLIAEVGTLRARCEAAEIERAELQIRAEAAEAEVARLQHQGRVALEQRQRAVYAEAEIARLRRIVGDEVAFLRSKAGRDGRDGQGG